MNDLARHAIELALQGDWEQAIAINNEILSTDPTNIPALNRIARAHLQMGSLELAEKISQDVIDIDPVNSIADKCLQKCMALRESHDLPSSNHTSDNVKRCHNFLEVPGKTKIVSLVHIGEPTTLATLGAGEYVQMLPRQHRVSITSFGDTYIGRLPDDIAARVIYLVKNGFEYSVAIKSILPKQVKIYIAETKAGRDGSEDSFPQW